MATHVTGRTLLASGFHAPAFGTIETLTDALIVIDGRGTIASVHRPGDADYARIRSEAGAADELVTLGEKTCLLPGFVDLHIHAPQYPQLGRALDVPLELWLQRYTFPLEARYADARFAARAYRTLVDDLLANGTTTAVYFATIHHEATRILAELCLERGQRALVGKVAMDNPDECPDAYRDASPDAAIDGTAALIEAIRALPGNCDGFVRPVIAPRFIPACTDAALDGLGRLAAETGCHVQTHCSESDWQHAYVLRRHAMTDTASLDRFGLLGDRTVLAHAPFVSADDMALIARRRAAIAHCPLSNAYFAGAVFPLREALAKGLRVGLGTDIAGGPSSSMLEGMRAAVMASRMLGTGTDPALPPDRRGRPGAAPVDIAEAFHLATAGGGAALGLPVGTFAAGQHFDAVAIDTGAPNGTIRMFDGRDDDRLGHAGPEDVLPTILYTASRANIAAVWVGGRHVAGSAGTVG